MTELLNFALDHLNYGWICFLMLLESTIIPVPSEFVVAPAAFNAAEGTLNIWLVILFATIGADCGASINYAAGYYLGRPLIYKFANSKWGKLCLLNQKKVEQAEKYFDDNGAVATITGRLVVGVRHLISIPAGLARMNFWRFLLFTTIGAGIWNCILAALGWWMHSFVTREELNGKIEEYSDYIKITLIVLVIGVIIFFLIKHFLREKNK